MLQLKEQELRSLLRDFYTLTRIRIVVFDAELQEVLSYPEEHFAFCSLLRQDPAMAQKCRTCDLEGCRRCARTGKAVTYRCHAGLTETVVPIQDERGVMGYLMFGQVLHTDSPQARQSLLAAFPQDRYPGLARAISSIPVKSREEIHAAATILQALTTYVCSSRLVAPGKNDFLRQLDIYIAAHLSESITAEDLCRDFRMSRTRFYDLASQYLGMGIAEYVRRSRIEQAKQLLLTTDRPVTDIAGAIGFADYTHFSRVFRQLTGLSARAFRQQSRSGFGK